MVSTSSAHYDAGPRRAHLANLSGQRHFALKTRTPRVWGLRGALIPLPALRDWQLLITFQKRFHARIPAHVHKTVKSPSFSSWAPSLESVGPGMVQFAVA